jgi:hypothetical protein
VARLFSGGKSVTDDDAQSYCPPTGHHPYYSGSGNCWRWDCAECEWTGLNCPSLDFAQREHASTAIWLAETGGAA